MKKMIRFTVLLLLITGVFIFSSGEKVAAATVSHVGFTVYSYESTDTTHDIPSEIDWNNTLVYINAELVFEMGSTVNPGDGEGQWSIHIEDWNNEHGPIVIFKSWPSEDSIILSNSLDKAIENFLNMDIVIIEFTDVNEYFNTNIYAYDDFEYEYENNLFTIINTLYNEDSVNVVVITSGLFQYSGGDYVYNFDRYQSDTYINYVFRDLSNEIDFFHINGYGYLDLTFGYNLIVIEYIPSEPEPDPEYTITFNTNGGTTVDPIVVTEGAMLYETIWNPPVETTRSGYTFDDWYKNAGLTIPVNESDTVTSDLTLYANWILNVVNYTVTFNTNGGSYIAPQSIVSGEQASRPTDPVKTGYTFNGWYTEMFFINLYNFNSAVSDNITLYAQWTLAEDPIEDEDDAWDVVVSNLPWIILGLIFVAIIFKR